MKFKTEKYVFEKISMNDVIKNSKDYYKKIKNRRSIREFQNKNIDIKIIKNAILSAGTAPNGANLQPWHFAVVSNNKIKKQIRLAAEKEEKNFYKTKAPKDWLDALEPLGTNENKEFLEDAPILIAIFEKKYALEKNKK